MLFPLSIASGLADRLSAIAAQIGTQASLCAASPGLAGSLFQRASSSSDYRIEKDFIDPTYNLEVALTLEEFVGKNNYFVSMVSAFDTHCNTAAGVKFDTYLTNSGLQVAQTFDTIYNAAKATHLLAKNVFLESDISLATIAKSGGVWTFASGTPLGSGTAGVKFSATIPESANQRLIASLPSGVSTAGTTINVSGLNDSGGVVWTQMVFPNGVQNAHVLNSNKVRIISNVSIVTSDLANGNTISLRNARERIIQL